MNALELSMFSVELWSANNKNAPGTPMFNVKLSSTKRKKNFQRFKVWR
jgi:hypothetical protein